MNLKIISAIFLISLSVHLAEASDSTEDNIKDSTYGLFSSAIVGWQYLKSSSSHWTKGVEEGHPVGSVATSGDHDVRAVALGIENDYVVFFTLRFFVDPLFPSPVIQNISSTLKDDKGSLITLDHPEQRGTFIRYGWFQLTKYSDVGGGALSVDDICNTVSEYDPRPPQCYEVFSWYQSGPPKENHNGGTYTRPHEDISVEQHFAFQDSGQKKCFVRYYDNHDVALLLVPAILFHNQPKTLNIKHPIISTDLMLRRSEELYGFKFNLLGQETMEALRSYHPANQGQFPGFEKVVTGIGLAMSPSVFHMLELVDHAIDSALPNQSSVKDIGQLMNVWQGISPDTLFTIGRLVLESRLSK